MDIIKKLYTGNIKDSFQDILDLYLNKKFVIINFLYFANVVSNTLLDKKNRDIAYYKAMKYSDFIMPDGIALQLFYFFAVIFGSIRSDKMWLYNCNGTDFTLDFLLFFKSKLQGNLAISVYGGDEHQVKGTEIFLKDKGFELAIVENGYVYFDWNKFEKNKKILHNTNHVLLVARGTPLQEKWILDNLEYIKKYNIIIMGVGGLFGFWSGYEKRAPFIFIKMKIEWLWRLFQNPAKNLKKVINSLKLPFYIFYYLLLKK